MAEFETTERGFTIYGSVTDTKGSKVQVQESSAVGQPKVWIFAESPDPSYKDPSPHLSAENVKELIGILKAFLEDAESPDNWRNDREYRDAYGEG